MMNVYFISGMGASCMCFDEIELPIGYSKKYIEWYKPRGDESLRQYAENMAKGIDCSSPFILVGYSFGGIIAQEMATFLCPQKIILLASVKNKEQMPYFFNLAKKIHFCKWFPMRIFGNCRLVGYLFSKLIYRTNKKVDLLKFLPQINPTYMNWAMDRIINWQPPSISNTVYQIHGTKDMTFPFSRIKHVYKNKHELTGLFPISGTGHLLAIEKPKEVSLALSAILNTE